MRFEFEYNPAERKRYDRVNAPRAVGPATFAVVWCLCFVPTVLCLLWMQMWSFVITGVVLILMASIVPAIVKFRSTVEEVPRVIEFNPVGKLECTGSSRGFIKWDSLDEVIETNHDFLFSRNHRFSLLPKRVIDDDQLETLRESIRLWKNHPEASNQPVEMFRSIFLADPSLPTWEFTLDRDDFVAATKSSSIKLVNDDTFSFRVVESVNKSRRWIAWLAVGVLFKLSLVLVFASLPPNRIDLAPLVIFICFNPIVLLVAMGFWIRRRGVNSVPRIHRDRYRLRLLEGGWAIGNEDLAVFNGWNPKSVFYVAKEFVGIRSDAGVIHVLPMAGFGGPDGVWQFLDRAIRMKKTWLHRKSEGDDNIRIVKENDGDPEVAESVNPYRSPSVSKSWNGPTSQPEA